MRKGQYRAGVPQGLFVTWHESGVKASEGEYRDGQMVGTWRRWHESGQMRDEVVFDGGVAHGQFRVWSVEGALVEQGEFKRGERVGRVGDSAFSWSPTRISGLALLHGGRVSVMTACLAWVPTVSVGRFFEAKLRAQLFAAKDSKKRKLFPVLGGFVGAALFPFHSLGFELSVGVESFVGFGFSPAAGIALIWRLRSRWFGLVDRIGLQADLSVREPLNAFQPALLAEVRL